jgi:hypothetical protein
MDWTTPLRSQQADFIERLKLGHLLPAQIPGLYGEVKLFSQGMLESWRTSEEDLIRRFAKETLKAYLDCSIVEVNGESGCDFRVAHNPHLGLCLKATGFDRNLNIVQWWVTPEERDRNTVIVAILHLEMEDRLDEYPFILAGFLPTQLLNPNYQNHSLSIADLFYTGGLKSYLESLNLNQPQKIDLQDTASLSNWLPDLHPQDLQTQTQTEWKKHFIAWVQTLALNAPSDTLRLYLYDLLNTQYYRQTLWKLYYNRARAIAAIAEPQKAREESTRHDAQAENIMFELAGVSKHDRSSLAAELPIYQ